MRTKLKILGVLMLLIASAFTASAYDFYVDGIYYTITSGKKVEVTYRDKNYKSYSGRVTIPASVTYSGTTYSVTSIGYSAFRDCSSLTSITIPNSVTSIGNFAFWGCSGLTAVHISDLAAWCKIEFGDDYSANPLYYAHNLYLNGEKVTNLVIPKSTQTIKNYTFYGCSSFTSIAMPNSVTKIGQSAFEHCSGLTSVTIPNSVTSIGNRAFMECSGLTSVTIPNSVTSIGKSAFEYCSGLTAVHITDLAAWYKIEFTNYSANPLCYAHNLYLNGEKVTNLVIPNSVTEIGEYAFSGCSGLTSVTIPNSVTSIGNFAFWGCSGLTSVNIPNSVTSIGISAFRGCSGLTSVTIPNSVTEIGGYAFRGCSGLTSVTIPNSVTEIGDDAFYGCSGLTSVTIPNSVTEIGEYAFSGCSGLTSVTIPNSVTSIGNHAFYGCSGLTSVTIPNSVTSIGDYAFYGCSGLTSVTVPNSVESIDRSVFRDCTALSKVSFADGNIALSIGQAFANCPLSEVYIGRNLNFDSSPFSGKTTLKTVTIGNSVTSIGNSAFRGCSGLESLTIGRNTSEIGDYTFSGCENISTIYSYAGTPPTIYEHTFENLTYAKANLYVPKGCVSIYEADPLWYPFYNILEGDYNGVDDVIADEASGEIVGYYNLQGVRSDDPWKGLNIVVYSDGTRRKIKY